MAHILIEVAGQKDVHPTNNNGGNVYGNSASMEADGLNELTTPISKITIRERALSGILGSGLTAANAGTADNNIIITANNTAIVFFIT